MTDIQPQALEAERALLGSMLIEAAACRWALDRIANSAFYHDRNRTVFSAIKSVFESEGAVDLVLVSEWLREKGLAAEAGWAQYLFELTKSVSTASHVEHYGKAVLRTHFDRLLIREATLLAQEDKRDAALQRISQICRAKDLLDSKGLITLADSLDKVIASLSGGPVQKLYLGFKELDWLTGGHEPGHLVTVGARTGVGKTAFCLAATLNLAQAGKGVSFFAGEMEPDQVTLRALASKTKIEHWRLRDRRLSESEEVPRVREQADSMRSLPVSYCRLPSPRLRDIRSTTDAARADVTVVDYLTRCTLPEGESMRVSVSRFMVGLKNFARDTNRLVILAAQINRRVDGNPDTPPNLSDLKESGTIEEESDCVVLLHIPKDQRHAEGAVPLSCFVAKNRHGRTGTCELVFDRRYMEVRDGDKERMGGGSAQDQGELGIKASRAGASDAGVGHPGLKAKVQSHGLARKDALAGDAYVKEADDVFPSGGGS